MTKVISLEQHIRETVMPQLQESMGKDVNVNRLPKLQKVVVNVGIGTILQGDKKGLEDLVNNVAAITGQKPIVINSRKAISNFKLRIGMPVGIKVTLRGKKMYDFLNKLINVIFPRIRDFQGFNKSCMDGQGNISIGIREHSIFPEISVEDINKVHGVQITVQTTAQNNDEVYMLLKALKFPFRENKPQTN